MADPWYADGLRFACTQCGDCCTGEPGFVWVDEAELSAIAARLDESLEQTRAVYTKPGHRGLSLREKLDGDCVFFERGKGCGIYDIRPRQCRTWPFWESNVRTPEDWEQTCSACPGSGTGQLFPAEEITRRLKVIRL